VLAHFTPREFDVMRSMADGLTTASTARSLGIAVKTVEAHRARVFAKLGVKSSSEAIVALLSNPGLLR
jgi:two-component system response regulator DctR